MIENTENDIINIWFGDLSKPLVSVCVITYNHEPYISETLDSILRQKTNFPFEIIIDDDCSTDKTQNIINQYTDKYPNIINANLRKQNVGVIYNEITSLQRTKGQYIAICEGDDKWLSEHKLQHQIDAMRNHSNCAMSFHPVRLDFCGNISQEFMDDYIKKSHNILSKTEEGYVFSDYSKGEKIFSAEEIIKGGGGFIATSSLIFSREVIDRYSEMIKEKVTEVNGEFIDYYLQILSSVKGGALFLPETMSTYLLHQKGVWTSRLIQKDMEWLSRSELGMTHVLNALDEVLDLKYHETFLGVYTEILQKIFGRKTIPLEQRIEMLKREFDYLDPSQIMKLQQLMINELLEKMQAPGTINLSHEQIDVLRDVSLAIEKLNIQYAYDLINMAHSARPKAPFLKQKMEEFEERVEILKTTNTL